MPLAEKIVALRKSKGFTQELLAEKSGISLRTIQRIEHGESVPRLFTLKTLADTLSVPFEEVSIQENKEVIYNQDKEPNSNENKEALNIIRMINSSNLLIIIFPVINIFIALKIWYSNRHNQIIYNIGKRIISFQILWAIFCFLFLLITPFVNHVITGSFMVGKISPLLLVYICMVMINLTCVLYYSFKLQRHQLTIYPLIPQLF